MAALGGSKIYPDVEIRAVTTSFLGPSHILRLVTLCYVGHVCDSVLATSMRSQETPGIRCAAIWELCRKVSHQQLMVARKGAEESKGTHEKAVGLTTPSWISLFRVFYNNRMHPLYLVSIDLIPLQTSMAIDWGMLFI